MSAPTFIPGYLAAITFDSQDYTITSNVLGLSATKNTPRKPVFGQQASSVISGQSSWSGSASGHLSAEGPLAALLATFAKADLVAFSIQIGELGGNTDAGIMAGNGTMSSLEITDDAEGEWDYSFNFEIDGEAAHTPPA